MIQTIAYYVAWGITGVIVLSIFAIILLMVKTRAFSNKPDEGIPTLQPLNIPGLSNQDRKVEFDDNTNPFSPSAPKNTPVFKGASPFKKQKIEATEDTKGFLED